MKITTIAILIATRRKPTNAMSCRSNATIRKMSANTPPSRPKVLNIPHIIAPYFFSYDLRSKGRGSRRANCVVSPVLKVAVSIGLEATTDGGGRRESKRIVRSDALPRRK